MAQGLFTLKQVNQALRQGAWSGTKKTSAVEYLVVAGGGGASAYSGGGSGAGGGAGGLLTGLVPVSSGSAITITVGAGGTGATDTRGTQGGTSSIVGSGVTFVSSTGGGGGGVRGGTANQESGGSGGSGGGAANAEAPSQSGGQGVVNQGFAGGSDFGPDAAPYSAAGGGGAGTRGANARSVGNGGAGIASAITGTVTAYAGGGGGGSYDATGGTGGAGGGGNGGSNTVGGATSGTANTGGGGGGIARTSPSGTSGGSGIVVISYPDVYAAPTSTTGSPTVSTSGSGSINFATAGYLSTGTGTAPSQSGDFTLEGWFNLSTFNQSGGYALLGGTTGGANYFGFKSTNIVINSATTSTEKVIACTLPSTNTWFHYCVMRSGSTLYAFLNGSLQGSSTWTDVLFSSGSLLVGGYGSATYICPGYMSNLRLTNTAVYSTSGFTVPTSPLTRVTGTALLMNTVSGAYAADATGTWSFLNLYTAPTWNASSPFTVTGYKNRVYTWTSSGSITF